MALHSFHDSSKEHSFFVRKQIGHIQTWFINILSLPFNRYWGFKIPFISHKEEYLYLIKRYFTKSKKHNPWMNIMICLKYFLRINNPIFTYFLGQFLFLSRPKNVLNFTWDAFSAKPIKLTFHTIRHFDTKQEWLQKTNAILVVDTLSKAMLHIHNISSKTQNVTVLRFIKYTSLPWEIAQGNVMISEFLFLVETMVSSSAQKLEESL